MESRFTSDDIIEDLAAVEFLLLNYEKQFKVRTPDFYQLYKQGKLQERWDFIDWAGLYEIKFDREKAYNAIKLKLMEDFVKQQADDPLLQLAGILESELTDISARHDEYIGQSLISNKSD